MSNAENRIEYPSGVWSIRDGRRLTYGKDNIKKVAVFSEADKITLDLAAPYKSAIRKAGKDPDNYCSAGSDILPKILIPEIEACIDYARQQTAAEKAEQQAWFDNAIQSGEAFRTVEIAAQYGAQMKFARRFRADEKPKYADWFQERGLVGFSASPRIKVQERAVRQVIGDRQSDGAFLGCENQAWIITAEQWDEIIKLSAEIDTAKAEARKKFEADEATDLQRKIATGFCFSCESYCHGDCGNYQTDPSVKFRRDLKQATREQNYGIQEGA